MFEVIPSSELPQVIDAAQNGRCVACYADAFGNGFYCPACDPPIQEIADLVEYGAPLQLTTGPEWLRGFRSAGVAHLPRTTLEPCTCAYGLHPTIWCPTHLIDVPGIGQRGAAYTFRISTWCPHHGDWR